MKKTQIRLSESDLHSIIKESVKKILKEGSKYGFNYDEADCWPGDDPWSGGFNREGNKADDMDWDFSDREDKIENQRNLCQVNVDRGSFAPSSAKNWQDYGRAAMAEPSNNYIQRELDDRWREQQQFTKALDNADKRPLHRKGSLNRELSIESKDRTIDKIVNEVFSKLKEAYGYNRQQGALNGMAKSLIRKEENPWKDSYIPYEKHQEAARQHNQLSNVTDRRSKGYNRAVSSFDPLELRQKMNQLGNNPQDTLKKSRQYKNLSLKK